MTIEQDLVKAVAENEELRIKDSRIQVGQRADGVQVLGGRKDDDNKPRFDLLPFDALRAVATVLTFGAAKYEDRNWEKGMKWGRLAAATLRHIGSWMCGYDYDEESKLHHLSHAACCVLMLLALVLRKVGQDDRGFSQQQLAKDSEGSAA